MSSIFGLPTQGSDATILITKVHLHPLSVLVEFWGKFNQERTADYQSLAKAIQSPGNKFKEFEGNPGDQCLFQIDSIWCRSRIVSRNGSKYTVFLIDKGMTYSTTTSMLAWGKKEHYHLPPEVEFCLLANVLPLQPENKWSPGAIDFLKSLQGHTVKAHVQDVLVPHRAFLLHIPSIARQMYEMGFGKKLDAEGFQKLVLRSLQTHSEAEVHPAAQQISMRPNNRLHNQQLYMHPELLTGTVVTVVVTEVTNPQRIFCQLKIFSLELKKQSEQITQFYMGRNDKANCIIGPEMNGFPCAAKGSDGIWYRAVLQQVLPNKKVVEVLNVDYGTKHFVQAENVRPLATEFFRMPVVTYICSLHGVIDKGVGWMSSQIQYLRSLILHKSLIAEFEYQSISEGVYYVTLYGEENSNLNNLFASKDMCLPEYEKTLQEYAIQSTAYSCHYTPQQKKNQRKMLLAEPAEEDKEGKEIAKKFPVEHLSLGSSHVAIVQHISNPSEFWIQTQNCAKESDDLMDRMYHQYKDSENVDVVRNPTVGLYCAVKADDGEFYRAIVLDIGATKIKVLLVDYGDSSEVWRGNIRTLPERFKKLPRLSLKCSLAGVRPKDLRWSQGANEFFIKAVTDKVLNVHVIAKCGDTYVVQLTDPKVQGEGDLGNLMCSSGFAERNETHKQPKTKITMQPAMIPAEQHSVSGLSGGFSNRLISTQTVDGPGSNERKMGKFKENMFPIGSVLDVRLSSINSPNDFWCQWVQNAGHLKSLMHDIQVRYAGSEFQPLGETACVARHPHNRKWYRALVVHKHEKPCVDVLFVDYGQTETISLYDLRRIYPEFLTLRGQAFRCSVLNPIDPSSPINDWNEESVAKFHSFVETAVSNFEILKCTLYAVTYSEQKTVLNIVDLETPFESVCTSMVNLVKGIIPRMASGQSFRLDTYYYSPHGIKIGTEEQVTVTCVKNVCKFYCQLERNTEVMKDLNMNVSKLCQQLENVKYPTVFGTLCFAKYTDGQWYRGQIEATEPSILVHFVDYGDTIEVDKSDLLPVPREANYIMSVPVQAVVCSLSDMPADVPSKVNHWFETSATECKFRALVVSRDPEGNLLVELYHGHSQINSKIKTMCQKEMPTEQQTVYQGWKASEAAAFHALKTPNTIPKQATEIKSNTETMKLNVRASRPECQMKAETKPTDINLWTVPTNSRNVCEKVRSGKSSRLELYTPPHQRKACESTQSYATYGSELMGAHDKSRKETLSTNIKQSELKSPGTVSQKESNVAPQGKIDKLPKLADLPTTSITFGMEADVYVSHCNSPLSFYLQLVREEKEIFSLVEKLSDPKSTPQINNIKDLDLGDLVQAQFEGDCLWYRAVVRQVHCEAMALVEYVDFGNTAMVPISKLGRLPEDVLQLPVYCTHCMLSDAATVGKEDMRDTEMVSAFKRDVGNTFDKVLKCQFIRQSGPMWEVGLEDNGVKVMCKVPTIAPTDDSEITREKCEQVVGKPAQASDKPQLSICSLLSHHQDIQEGQQLEVYISTVNGDKSFWCQSADTEELDRITLSVSEFQSSADHTPADADSLSPGSPCIARFADDHLWYRAEVLDKAGDELSVLFVDYGNKSRVKGTDVRKMPCDLLGTPPQAFLCKLEGFDVSHGSWNSSSVDEIASFMADKLLQLTVIKTMREDGKIKFLVQLECDGQVINGAPETWRRSSAQENKPEAVGCSSSETPPSCESTEKETALPEDQPPEYFSIQDIEIAVSCFSPGGDHSEELNADNHVELHAVEESLRLASSPKNSESSEDTLHPESFAESIEEETDQNCSECNPSTEPEIFRATEGLRETVAIDGEKKVPILVISQTDMVPHDSGIEDILSPSLVNQDDPSILTLSQNSDTNLMEADQGLNIEGASVMDTYSTDESNSPSDEVLREVKAEFGMTTTDLTPPYEEVKNQNTRGSSDMSLGKQYIPSFVITSVLPIVDVLIWNEPMY